MIAYRVSRIAGRSAPLWRACRAGMRVTMLKNCSSSTAIVGPLGLVLITGLSVACSASSEESSEIARGNDGSGGQPTAVSAVTSGSGMGSSGDPVIVTTSSGAMSTTGATPGDTCATASADAALVKEPVDIIMVVDNSGSMDNELESVENNINQNFGAILTASDIDYRLIALSRHRDDDNTSLCITQPLSTLASCPAESPGISERFFHYSTKVESDDSFDLLLDTYEAPFDQPCLSMCDNGETEEEDNEDKYENAPNGWSQWLREGAKKVFLEITDANEDMPVATFLSELTAMGPQHFGTSDSPTFIFHSITGVAEKATATEPYVATEGIVVETCTGNGGDVTNAGETYQELSVLTNGLRLPVCQFQAYDAVFRAIAEDVIVKTDIACDFAIPEAPTGAGDIDLDNVAVNYVKGDGSGEVKFRQAAEPAECEPEAFYIQDNRIVLCAEACDTIRADPFSMVDVLFTCESQIIIK